MKKVSSRLMELAMLLVLGAACVGAVGQLTARAQIAPIEGDGSSPACAGLSCYDGSDCGSKCFCNRPSSTCFEN
jgi:hypothetical protein